jgi:DNA-binding MarR family transcriptional regulator
MSSRSSEPKGSRRRGRRGETGSGQSVETARRRRQLAGAIRESLRELVGQLSLLNHLVGTQLEIRDVDVDCLDLLDRHGPLSPSALARRAGLHPATMTGILDRLEGGGWVARERDPADRRAVVVRAVRERRSDLMRLYAGMNGRMNHIYTGYEEKELELLADFLRRAASAGRSATDELSDNQ